MRHLLNTGILSFKRDKYKLLFIAKEQETCEELLSTPLAVSHMVGGKVNKRYVDIEDAFLPVNTIDQLSSAAADSHKLDLFPV